MKKRILIIISSCLVLCAIGIFFINRIIVTSYDENITEIPSGAIFDGNIAFAKPTPEVYEGIRNLESVNEKADLIESRFSRKAYSVFHGSFTELKVNQKLIEFPEGASVKVLTFYYCDTDKGIKIYPSMGAQPFYNIIYSNYDTNIFYVNFTSDNQTYVVDIKKDIASVLFDNSGIKEFKNYGGNSQWARCASVSPDGKKVVFYTTRKIVNGENWGQTWIKDITTGEEKMLIDHDVPILSWDDKQCFYYCLTVDDENHSFKRRDIYQYDTTINKSVYVLSNNKISSQFSADGKYIIEFLPKSIKMTNIIDKKVNEIDFSKNSTIAKELENNHFSQAILSKDEICFVGYLRGQGLDLSNGKGVNKAAYRSDIIVLNRETGKVYALDILKEGEHVIYGWTAENFLVIGSNFDPEFNDYKTTEIIDPTKNVKFKEQ